MNAGATLRATALDPSEARAGAVPWPPTSPPDLLPPMRPDQLPKSGSSSSASPGGSYRRISSSAISCRWCWAARSAS